MSKQTMKKRVLPWLAMGSSLAVIGAIVFMPTPVAKAQTDPGQNPEPTPHAEATATPTPCPQATTETNWVAHASLKSFACINGSMGLDYVAGSYSIKTTDVCNGNSTKSHTTSWVINNTEQRDETLFEGTDDEVTLKVNWYYVQEVSDDGTKFYGEWKKGDRCCGATE